MQKSTPTIPLMITQDQLTNQTDALQDLKDEFEVCYPVAYQNEKELTHLEVLNVMNLFFGGTDRELLGDIISDLKDGLPSPEFRLRYEIKQAEEYAKFLSFLLNKLQKVA